MTVLSRHFFRLSAWDSRSAAGKLPRVADMARIERFLGAQIEHQRSLIHEPHRLHGGKCGEGLEARLDLVDDDRRRLPARRRSRGMDDEQ